jgi:hypothetical protein
MFPFDGSDPDRVLAAGDWHGNTDRAGGVISSAGMREIPVVLQLGDFGFWVPGANTDRYLDILDKLCEQWNVTLLWVDGNHEDFDTLNALPLHDSGVRVIRENIVHLPRGFRWTWHGPAVAGAGRCPFGGQASAEAGAFLVAAGVSVGC